MHRGILLAALLLTSLAATPAAQAQDLVPLLSDPAGDVRVNLAGAPAVSDLAAVYSSADLVGLAITETRSEFVFTFTVDDLKPADQETAPEGFSMSAFFTHNGREFRLEAGRGVAGLGTVFYGYVDARDAPTADWSRLLYTLEDLQPDFTADTLAFPVQRDLLADADGAAPFPGRSLEAIHARSGSSLRDTPLLTADDPIPEVVYPAAAADDMPDDASAAASYAVRLGVAQTGHAFLSSDLPFRASNGEATTYILNATASNLGDAADTFTFSVSGASSRVTVVVPIQVLALEAGATRDVPVLVTVPFGHDHGDVESFILEMTSETDAGSVGRLEMGIRFLAVAQPAGHHDTLYLHSGAPKFSIGPVLQFQQGFLSTLEDDPAATGANHYSSGGGAFVGGWAYYFQYNLQPALQVGLDLDLLRTGRLALPVGTTEPLLATTVEGNVYVWSPEDQQATTVAVLQPSEPVDIEANGQHLFDLEFEVDEDADRVPYQKGNQLYLNLRITTLSGAPTLGLADAGAYIAPGGSLKLPLNEWHDPVDDVLASLAGPGLSPLGAQERMVNPGEAVIFEVSIANPSDDSALMLLEVSGPNAAWASLPATRVEVPAHDVAKASIVVRAPADAVSGERADLVLQAYSKEDPTARGLLRFVTLVDTGADHPDDTVAAQGLEQKDSPGAGVAAVVLLLALVVASLRRRR